MLTKSPVKITSLEHEIRQKIIAVAAKAKDSDKKIVEKIIKKAETGVKDSEQIQLTSAACAILFLNHNSHNRAWRASVSCEYSRRMNNNVWKYNSTTIGFYIDGLLEDGQHRIAAVAISKYTWLITVVYGVDRSAIDTVDDNLRRSGADHAGLDAITLPSRKQSIVKAAAAYFVRAGNEDAALKSPAEVRNAILADNALLETAMVFGTFSRNNVVVPQLKENKADIVAFIMLKSGWPQQRIKEKLALFQTGMSTIGENDPFFVAASILDARRKKWAHGEKLTTIKEIGIVIFAMIETEKGAKTIQTKNLRAAVDRGTLPNPQYPDLPNNVMQKQKSVA